MKIFFSRMLSLPGRAHLEQVLDLASHQLHHHLHHHLPTHLCIQTRRKRGWNVLNSSSYWGKLWQKLNWFNLVFSRTSDDVSTVVNWLPSRLSKTLSLTKLTNAKLFLHKSLQIGPFCKLVWFNFCQARISVNVLWTWVSWRRLLGLVFHQDTGAESGRFSVDIFLQVVEMKWWRGRERSTLDMSTSTSTTKKRTFIKIHSGENYFSNLPHCL